MYRNVMLFQMQVTWRNKLVFKFKNLRKKKRKSCSLGEDGLEADLLVEQPPSKKPHIDMAQHKSNVLLLQAEFKKKKPKSKVVKNIMDETEAERRRWITADCPTSNKVVAEYPALRIQEWVSWL